MIGFIVDLSSNNAHPIDYAAAKSAGCIAAIVKATEGTSYVNPYYAEDAAGFEAVGVPVLAYHFASFTDSAAEAMHFLAVAGGRARVLDVETNENVAWMNAFLEALGLPTDEELTYGSASTLPRSGIRSLLWPASYGKNYGFGDCWQYTDAATVAGIPGKVDASVWIGSQADFDALFNVTPPAPAGPTVSPAAAVPGQEGMMNVDFEFGTTGSDGVAYSPFIPIPEGCTHMISVSVDVADPGDFTPPHHDVDLPAAPLGHSGVVAEPCVGDQPAGQQRARLAGGAAGHFYTGHAIFA